MKAQREISPQKAMKNKFYSYPAHKILGVFETPEKVKETLDELKKKGFQETDIEVICNAGRIDFSGEENGFWGRIVRSFERLGTEGGYLDSYDQELKQGNLLLIVTVRDEKKQETQELLQSHGGLRLAFFGNWTIEGVSEAQHITFDQHSYGIRRELETSFGETLKKIQKALQEEGFGVLTEINMKEKLKEKLDVDFRKYVILGACNPLLAHGALQEDLDIGLLLPCNVIVYEFNGGSVVAAIDATKMLSVAENPQLEKTAETVNEKLYRAIESL